MGGKRRQPAEPYRCTEQRNRLRPSQLHTAIEWDAIADLTELMEEHGHTTADLVRWLRENSYPKVPK